MNHNHSIENGNVVCAWCIVHDKVQTIAITLVRASNGRTFPACSPHAVSEAS